MVTSHNDEIVLWMGMGKYNMTKQPEALRLADILQHKLPSIECLEVAAAELRRLHEVNQMLLDALKVLSQEADGFSVSGVYFNEKSMGHKGLNMAYAAIEKAGEA